MTARTDRTLALIVGVVLAGFFTICSAVQVAEWTAGSVEHTAHEVVPGPVHTLTIEAHSGDITLVPSDTSEVVVDSRSRGTLHTPKLDIQPEGTRVFVAGGCPEFTFGHCSAEIVVRVPAGTAVNVDAASGDLHVRGLSGAVDLHTASGDIEASELAGRVTLESASGDIDAGALRATRVSGHTASGDVNLQFEVAPELVDAETASGDVNLTVPPGGELYRVDVDTNSGDVMTSGIGESDHAPRLLRARSNSGDITIDYG